MPSYVTDKTLLLTILLCLSLAGGVFASGYEDSSFVINIYQGWDLLGDGKLVFDHTLSNYDQVHDFIAEQYDVVLAMNRSVFSVPELQDLFASYFHHPSEGTSARRRN